MDKLSKTPLPDHSADLLQDKPKTCQFSFGRSSLSWVSSACRVSSALPSSSYFILSQSWQMKEYLYIYTYLVNSNQKKIIKLLINFPLPVPVCVAVSLCGGVGVELEL